MVSKLKGRLSSTMNDCNDVTTMSPSSRRERRRTNFFRRFRNNVATECRQQTDPELLDTTTNIDPNHNQSTINVSDDREGPVSDAQEKHSSSKDCHDIIVALERESIENESNNSTNELHDEFVNDNSKAVQKAEEHDISSPSPIILNENESSIDDYFIQNSSWCPTAILNHSFIANACAPFSVPPDETINKNIYDSTSPPLRKPKSHLIFHPDDPTVQESFECMFANQLIQDGLPKALFDDSDNYSMNKLEIVSPSAMNQTLGKNRSTSNRQSEYLIERSKLPSRTSKAQSALKSSSCPDLPGLESVSESSNSTVNDKMSSNVESKCPCCSRTCPPMDPSMWPQCPLLLRPTPGRGTRVKGIRFASKAEYLWTAEMTTLQWPNELKKHWNKPESELSDEMPNMFCPNCVVLPINNGNELEGEALVSDFESDLFEGTLLVRIRGSEGTTSAPYDDSKGYFFGVNRRYQAVVQGRFKSSMPWTECFSGIKLNRPCGKLPAKWILKGGVNVIKFFAPQLECYPDGQTPYVLNPLGSGPQTIVVEEGSCSVPIDGRHQEPFDARKSLMHIASNAPSAMQRARGRKKAFDKILLEKNKTKKTDTSKLYTFEFLQHLINFDEFTIEFGSMFGSISLSEILDGQPIQTRAVHNEQTLWAFDLWHEMLYEDAIKYEKTI